MPVTSYYKLEKIGEGTYGIVYKAKERSSGKSVALKKIRPESENEGIPATTIREILLLKNLKHPSIINLIEIIHNENKMYLVFEYIETDLKRLMDEYAAKKKAFRPKSILKIAFQLLSGIAFCHAKNIFHRDLKPQNILIDKGLNVKIADFGLGRAANIPLRKYTTEIVTLWYRAPELLLGCEYYDASVDIWALGCILIELHTLVPAFYGDSEIDQLYRIFAVLGTPNNRVWEGVEEFPLYKKEFPVHPWVGVGSLTGSSPCTGLIEEMLVYNPLSRLAAADAMDSPLFYEFELGDQYRS